MQPDPKRNELAVARANAFDQLAAKFTGLYDLGIAIHPLWGPRLRKAVAHIQGPRVLEVSFGTGFLMSQYADRYETTGLDYNPRMVAATQKRLDQRGMRATLVRGDAHAMPFPDDSFDTLINTDAFTLYNDPVKAMGEFHRVLRPGGRLVLLEYHYPADRNWLGMQLMAIPRMLGMPMRDFPALLSGAGFTYEDYPVGMSGVLHMFVGTK